MPLLRIVESSRQIPLAGARQFHRIGNKALIVRGSTVASALAVITVPTTAFVATTSNTILVAITVPTMAFVGTTMNTTLVGVVA